MFFIDFELGYEKISLIPFFGYNDEKPTIFLTNKIKNQGSLLGHWKLAFKRNGIVVI